MPQASAAYIHIPFCAARCGYCDFNTYADILPIAARYTNAVKRHIGDSDGSGPLKTVYFGGGTPSLLEPDLLLGILEALRSRYGLQDDAEVSFEANPESVKYGKLATLREGGFNRISIGAQTFDDESLRRLDRVHTHAQFLEAYHCARKAGFGNVSVDIMFGLPGQSRQKLAEQLIQLQELAPEHVSAYCLTIEQETPFWGLVEAGKLLLPDDEQQVRMMFDVREALTSSGYEHYEISNYALSGHRCRHNEVYWRNEEYFGFGAGAVAYLAGRRTKWELRPEAYGQQVERAGFPAEAESETLEAEQRLGETAMLMLRTADGLDMSRLRKEFGDELVEAQVTQKVRKLQSQKLLEAVGDDRVRLTVEALPLANEVLSEFV